MIIPLNADHHSICRYRAKTQDYRLVEAAVRELANAEKPNSRGRALILNATFRFTNLDFQLLKC